MLNYTWGLRFFNFIFPTKNVLQHAFKTICYTTMVQLHFLLLILSVLSALRCTSSSKGFQITSLPLLTKCRIVHTHLNGQNRGHASLSYRYDSWKQSKHIFLAPSTSPHLPSEGTGEWWSASICNRFSRLPRIKVVSAKMTTSSSAGRAWSFTSLMNKKTVSHKCHSCLNCQMWTQSSL